MKKYFFFMLVVFVSFLLIKCGKGETSKDCEIGLQGDYLEMIQLIDKIKNPGFKPSELTSDDIKKLVVLRNNIISLSKLSDAMKVGVKSKRIPFDTAVAKRDIFRTKIDAFKIFPNYFSFTVSEMEVLVNDAKDNKMNIVRMYPVFDDRMFTYTDATGAQVRKSHKFSFAFIAADSTNKSTQPNYKSNAFVLDVLDPCPPPSGCQELKPGAPTEN